MKKISLSPLKNMKSYKVLVFLSMTYMSCMLCNAILTNRYIGNDKFFILGGTLTSPFIFIMDNIIAEIYGYKIAKTIILWGFFSQTIFCVICQLVVTSPYPSFFRENFAYAYILGPSLLRIDFSGFIAYLIANLTNIYILTRWKTLLKGQLFLFRSISASFFSEGIYTCIAIIMMELNSIPLKDIAHVITISFFIKIFYSAIFAIPSASLVNYLKKSTGMDIYDFPKKLTPFIYKKFKLP